MELPPQANLPQNFPLPPSQHESHPNSRYPFPSQCRQYEHAKGEAMELPPLSGLCRRRVPGHGCPRLRRRPLS